MKTFITALALPTALAVPGLAHTRPLTLTRTMNSCGGDGANPAFYVTTPKGSMSAARGWSVRSQNIKIACRAGIAPPAAIPCRWAALPPPAPAGRAREITLDLADALFDAGYTIHVAVAVEDMRGSPDKVALPIIVAGASVAGTCYNASFTSE